MNKFAKKIISSFLVFVMAATAFVQATVTVSAEETATILTSEDFEYTVSDDGVTITKLLSSDKTNIIIPDEIDGYPVIELAENSFRDSNVTSVGLPSGLKKIGKYTFLNCEKLAEIYLPEELECIEPHAFNNTVIKTLNIPAGVTELEPGSFGLCKALVSFEVDEDNPSFSADENGVLFNKDKTVLFDYPLGREAETYVVPESVKEIGADAFFLQTGITNVVLPEGVEKINDSAFSISRIKSINLPESLKIIGDDAFSSCSLQSVTIPSGVESVGVRCFNGCSALAEVTINCNMNEIPLQMFCSCSDLSEIVIPESVSVIGDKAFAKCTSLTEIELPSGLTDLGETAFEWCTQLKSVEFNEGLKSIGRKAFNGCSSLEKLIFPESLVSLGTMAYEDCPLLTEVYIGANLVEDVARAFVADTASLLKYEVHPENTVLRSDEYGVLYSKDGSELIAFPQGSPLTKYVVPEGTVRLSWYSFCYSLNLKEISLPSTLESIGAYSFYGTDQMTEVYYASSEDDWNKIEIDSNNSELLEKSVVWNYGKTSGTLGENIIWSYDEESKILSVEGSGEMPSLTSAEEYGWYFFKDEIEAVDFANSITSVGDNAFSGYPTLKEVYLGTGIEKIGENAFSGCSSLAIVTSYSLNFTAQESSFGDNDERLIFLYNAANTQAEEYAEEHAINRLPVYYDEEKKVMNYDGELTVYSDLPYLFLSEFVKQHSDMEYLYFEKIVFYGIEPETIDVEELENDTQAQYLTFNKLYVSLKKVKDGSKEDVSFEDFLTLLENGDYDSFMFELKSDEGKQQLTFVELLEKATDYFITNALRITSKIVNFFRKLFK